MRLALAVNNPSRDLAGLTLLATELSRRGAHCFLVPVALQRRELSALAPDFVLFNHLRSSNQPLVQKLSEAGVRVGVLDDEGGVFSSFECYSRQLAPEVDTRHAVSLFCSWGPKLAKHVREHHWYRSEAITVTGHPRFDFYAPLFRDVALPDHPDPRHFSGPVALIDSRFSRANPVFVTREEEVRIMVKNRGFSPEAARDFQNVMTQAMHDMVKMTNLLAERFPQITFVFRPHPFERLETYRELLTPATICSYRAQEVLMAGCVWRAPHPA